jgi:phospholipase/carboxylesterase
MEQIVVWRKPAKHGPFTPLVVLLHGRGADEYDLIDVADALPATFAFASLRAPVAIEGGGYTWYESRGGPGAPTAQSVRAAIDGVRGWLDGPEAAGFNRERTYVFGFSAGMLMASALLLDDPARFAGAVLLSGAIPFGAGLDLSPQRLAAKPIFHGHGSLDTVIPPERVAQSMRYLREESGAELTDREYRHAHAISNRELADIAEWLSARS